MIALLATAALAEAPLPDLHPALPRAERLSVRAYRANMVSGPGAASTRLALVEDFDGPFIAELTLRGQVGWHVFAMALEVAGTAGVSPTWSGVGLGNTVLDLRVLFGRGSTHAIGLRGTFPTGLRDGTRGPVGWWGTVPAATVPTFGVALAYEGASPSWVWHFRFGLRADPFWAYHYVAAIFDLAWMVGTVQPLGGGWSVVAETEVLLAHSPWHLRALARRDLGAGWTVDAGIALPVLAMIQDPTLQVLARAEKSW